MLHSYTVVHHAVHPLLASWIPYNIAVVELTEGPKLVTVVRAVEPNDLVVGAALTCVIEEVAPGFSLPYFQSSRQESI